MIAKKKHFMDIRKKAFHVYQFHHVRAGFRSYELSSFDRSPPTSWTFSQRQIQPKGKIQSKFSENYKRL